MGRILDTINGPSDVKKLSLEELKILAEEIRQELITVLSKNGGHLGPNLGVVELTLALHYVFETPRDKFVFDVSHQAYVHKLLTGRRERFSTIRQPGGLSGFMCRAESPHDCYGAGHAGTALSAALGMAVGRDRLGEPEHVVALCGDAAFTCGITYEALNNVAGQVRRLIVILNDNEWSIDRNVGAIAAYFNRIATNEKYAALREQAQRFLEKLAGKGAVRVARKAEEAVKGMLWPSVLFEEFGFTYYGPLDGHNIAALVSTLEFLKKQETPVLLHVLTQKGRGFPPALEKQKKFHGLGPYDPVTGATPASSKPTFSEVFADTLIKLAEKDRRVIAITAAMPNGTCLDRFQPRFPDRYFDVGIAEEHAVIFAAGLATKGFKPFCAIYSTFLQRAFDPVIHDVCLQNLPVVFCLDRGGLSGDDGPTHHGLFDVAYLRGIPNMVLLHPKDEDELADMLCTALHHPGPIAIRYPRGTGPGVPVKDVPEPIPIGKAQVLREGTTVAIFTLGIMATLGESLADALESLGISTALINARSAKPLDQNTLESFAQVCDVLVTIEDHVLAGGFGSAVLEALNDRGLRVPVVRVGWPDCFIEHGKVDGLRAKYGLTRDQVLQRVLAALRRPCALVSA
ncbi:1-deoxy-D-xylulose-5-phosphate synthase [Candidatus Methylacidithermus pantelleriae]|uniref:1-deoxy-D-xylulose-5-phosphate synthase n=1 Tax=Candidatus Methylacidithermus pantelleriae TaxID=2744239 RepID=A0A8J2BLC9_9BACT|nr:1-deoxy-D-xylulose-5-phosphate synthase [Candidatus Methylacidithermus pantelleriae]CAF0698924.1 1-deoxy-D-xylulose-5-phosphate synthase [Candidatus Methylacidithermus pantelleriae]